MTPDDHDFTVGSPVTHKAFGNGVVEKVLPDGKLAIQFKKAGLKAVKARFVHAPGLRVLPDPEGPRNFDANDLGQQFGLDAVRDAIADARPIGRKGESIHLRPGFNPMTGDTIEAEPTPADAGELPVLDMTGWDAEAPKRRSAWGSWLPLNQTTMLTGVGGIGKSLFEQMLLTCIAIGRPFLGMEAEQGPLNTLYVTCEDDADELWRRQLDICVALGIAPTDLIGKLHLVSLTGEEETALMEPDDRGKLRPTARWHQLRNTCQARGIRIYAFDNATDAFNADHSEVNEVAKFVNMLTGLAIQMDGAAMIIHHPNKAGDDWLGSVAWHNKVRSRLIIKADDEDGDQDLRTIENPKANYGPRGGKIRFRWWQGAFVCDDDIPHDQRAELDELIKANGAAKAFMRCLDVCTEQRRNVSHHNGSNYAPKIFAGMTEGRGVKVKEFASAMERLLHTGEIALDQELWRGPNRNPKVGIARTNPPL